MELVITLIFMVAAFLGGGLLVGKHNKNKQIKKDVKTAEVREQEGSQSAKQKYEQRVKAAESAAAAAILDRPVSGDPVADLADRVERHRNRGGSS